MKRFTVIIIILTLLCALAGCGETPEVTASAAPAEPVIRNDVAAAALSAEPDGADYTADVRLSGGTASVTGSGAALEDGVLRITAPGVYRLAGELDGSVVVDCEGNVELALCGLRIRGEGYALYAKSCDRLTLRTDAVFGQNYFSATATQDDGGIALESKAPLTLCGDGWLTLQSAGDGLHAKTGVTVQTGSLTVNAAGFGLKGDTVELDGGSLTVDVQGDALKGDRILLAGGECTLTAADEGMDAETVSISGGTLTLSAQGNAVKADIIAFAGGSGTIWAGLDALQAANDLTVSGGDWNIKTANGAGMAYYHIDTGGFGPGFGGGGSSATYTLPDYSCKALKSDASIHLLGGKIVLDSEDDAIHGATDVVIDGAELYVRSNDDGIHCDKNLTVDYGYILISSCFEGLEGEIVTFNGGYADIYSANDGINTSSSTGGGWGGNSAAFYMNGGECHVYVFGSSNIGDGVDSNGAIVISGGYITSSTSGYTQENGMDSGSSFVVYGGIVASGGNSGMQESASSYSTQCTAVLSLTNIVSAGTECVVTDEDGNVILTFTPYRDANSLVFSHPDFRIGKTYTVTAGSYTQDFTFETTSYSNRSGHGFGRPF